MTAETELYMVINVVFRSVTSIFQDWNASELSDSYVFLENDSRIFSKSFQGLGENTCSLQPSMKNTAPDL